MIVCNRPITPNDGVPRSGYYAAMSRVRHRPPRCVIPLGLLLALTMIARLVVPGGYMPADLTSGMLITLCSGSGAATITVDLGPEGGKRGPAPTTAADCHFGALGHGLAHLGSAPLPPPPWWTLSRHLPRFHVQLATPAAVSLPPPATGPPAGP